MDNTHLRWGELSRRRSQLYGLCILWIVLFHVAEIYYEKLCFSWELTVLLNSGNLGVDIFLLLSGISMGYAWKRYPAISLSAVGDFYRRRLGKVLKIYLCFCVPFLLGYYLLLHRDPNGCLLHMTFLADHSGIFWYVGVILLCYLISPFLEYNLRKGRRIVIYWTLGIYIAFLAVFSLVWTNTFRKYEILLARIPIFVVGSLVSVRVQENRPVKTWEFAVSLAVLFLRSPIRYALRRIPGINWGLYDLLTRLMMGASALAAIFLFLMVLQCFENTKFHRWLGKIGGATLEIYVFHVALMPFLSRDVPRALGITIDAYREIFVFALIYIPLSLLGGWLLHRLMNPKKRLPLPEGTR